MFKRILFVSFMLLCLFVINNLAHSIYDLSQKEHLLTQTKQELAKKQAQNTTLKRELAAAQSTSFVEQQARDKLFLVKPGEEHVIVPQDLSKTPQVHITTQTSSHWQEWVHVFFY